MKKKENVVIVDQMTQSVGSGLTLDDLPSFSPRLIFIVLQFTFVFVHFDFFFSLFLSRKKVKKPFPLRQINSKLHFGEAKRLRNTTNAHSSLVQFCLLLLSFPLFFVSSSIYVRCGFAQVDFVQPMSALRRRLSLCYLAILVGAKTERTKQRVTHSLSWPKKVLVVFAEVVFLPFSDSLTFANGRNEEKAQQS